jgi:peptide chain release factor 3
MADDVDGDPVYLASSNFMMRRTAEQNTGLTFRDIKDFRAEKTAA